MNREPGLLAVLQGQLRANDVSFLVVEAVGPTGFVPGRKPAARFRAPALAIVEEMARQACTREEATRRGKRTSHRTRRHAAPVHVSPTAPACARLPTNRRTPR
jgi:hypothetical protein